MLLSSQENIYLVDKNNIKEVHLDVKQLQMNRRGNSLFTKISIGLY